MKGAVKEAEPETGWFEISEDFWLAEGEVHPKLRLLADHNVSIDIVRECRRAKIAVQTAAELGVHKLDDDALYDYCRKAGLALLTGDGDFWSKSKYGPEKGGYVIVVRVPSSRRWEFLRAFGLFFGTFGRSFGGRLSEGLRVLVTPRSFYLEMVGLSGSRVRYELKLHRRRLWAREL
jgi:hypothetical protein